MATEEKHDNFYVRLAGIQQDLVATKSQFNSFGGYNYRSCEDILSAVKPLCKEAGIMILLTDVMECIGERYYIKAIAQAVDLYGECPPVEVTAYAREELTKKGMDASQITGSASSYARKYALNGLLCIDDTKDADTMDNTHSTTQVEHPQPQAMRSVDPETFDKSKDSTGEVTFSGGKYAGKPVSSVTDFGYLKWVVEKSNMKPDVKEAAQGVLDSSGAA